MNAKETFEKEIKSIEKLEKALENQKEYIINMIEALESDIRNKTVNESQIELRKKAISRDMKSYAQNLRNLAEKTSNIINLAESYKQIRIKEELKKDNQLVKDNIKDIMNQWEELFKKAQLERLNEIFERIKKITDNVHL